MTTVEMVQLHLQPMRLSMEKSTLLIQKLMSSIIALTIDIFKSRWTRFNWKLEAKFHQKKISAEKVQVSKEQGMASFLWFVNPHRHWKRNPHPGYQYNQTATYYRDHFPSKDYFQAPIRNVMPVVTSREESQHLFDQENIDNYRIKSTNDSTKLMSRTQMLMTTVTIGLIIMAFAMGFNATINHPSINNNSNAVNQENINISTLNDNQQRFGTVFTSDASISELNGSKENVSDDDRIIKNPHTHKSIHEHQSIPAHLNNSKWMLRILNANRRPFYCKDDWCQGHNTPSALPANKKLKVLPKQSAIARVPLELWIIIVRAASGSIKEFAEYTRTSRLLRRIFWTSRVKAEVLAHSNFGCLAVFDIRRLETTASEMMQPVLESASHSGRLTATACQRKYQHLLLFMKQDDAFDVIQWLTRYEVLLSLDKIVTYVKREKLHSTTFFNLDWENYKFMTTFSLENPMQYNFEKMWTRAAYESKNLKVLSLLLSEGFKFHRSIHHAIEHDDVELCQILLENGYNLDSITTGVTAMHLAARSGSLKVAQLLVDMGHKVKTFDANGMSPLHAAIDASQIELVKYLGSIGGPTVVNTCASVGEGVTALSLATSHHKIKIIKILLNCGADVYIRDFDQSTLLHVATKFKAVEILKFYLSIWHSDLDPVRGDTRITPLLEAVSAKSLKSFAYLLDAGCKYDGKAILKVACSVGSVEFINALVARGIAVERDQFRRKQRNIKSILRLSAERNQNPLGVRILKYDWTPLNVCILNNHNKMARFLLDRAGYSVDLCTNWGQSPFYVAAGEMGNIPLARFLLARHAHWDIRVKSSGGTSARTGFSALHRAVQRADIDTVKFLIGLWGPESNRKEKEPKFKHNSHLRSCVDEDGSNPLHIAATVINKNIGEIIEILISVRPDWLKAHDNRQRTPFKVFSTAWESRRGTREWQVAYHELFFQLL
ncbi:hypothetical protein HDU76_001854 [Blyttiomyces sp. JEL0837]|nr:hypothetical protein HDU76_001854 [Blyttiomyces sp. JEL0837]